MERRGKGRGGERRRGGGGGGVEKIVLMFQN